MSAINTVEENVKKIVAIKPVPPPKSNIIKFDDNFPWWDRVALFENVWDIWLWTIKAVTMSNTIDFSHVSNEQMKLVDKYMNAMGFRVFFDRVLWDYIAPVFYPGLSSFKAANVSFSTFPDISSIKVVHLEKNFIEMITFTSVSLPSTDPSSNSFKRQSTLHRPLSEYARILRPNRNVDAAFRVEFDFY